MINEKNITDFIQLHMFDKTMNLMKFIHRSPGYIDNIDYLQEVMSVMEWKNHLYWLRGIAGLINYAQ